MKKNGISLITLLITIIVIIILSGTIIFSISKSNIINKGKEAVFKNDVANLREELQTYHYSKIIKENGKYSMTELNADKTMVEYEGVKDNSITMADILKSINQKKEYLDIFEIYEGELVYIGSNKEEKKWAEEVGVISKYAEPKVEISKPSIEEIKSGETVEYEITVSSNFKLEYVNFEGNIDLIKIEENKKNKIRTIENNNIQVIEERDNSKKVKVIIDTLGLENGYYSLEIKEKIAKDEMGMENIGIKIGDAFNITTKEYEDIKIEASTTNWTNQNVTVTITYPTDLKTKEYKIGTGEWKTYTGVVTVTENTTVYARGKDAAGNTTDGSKSLTILNIDKTAPTLTISSPVELLLKEVATFDAMNGITATDNNDSSPQITVEGTVQKELGEYTLTYTATDKNGNKTVKTRIIKVVNSKYTTDFTGWTYTVRDLNTQKETVYPFTGRIYTGGCINVTIKAPVKGKIKIYGSYVTGTSTGFIQINVSGNKSNQGFAFEKVYNLYGTLYLHSISPSTNSAGYSCGTVDFTITGYDIYS